MSDALVNSGRAPANRTGPGGASVPLRGRLSRGRTSRNSWPATKRLPWARFGAVFGAASRGASAIPPRKQCRDPQMAVKAVSQLPIRQAVMLAVAAEALLTLMDALIKGLSARYPTFEIAFLRFAFGALWATALLPLVRARLAVGRDDPVKYQPLVPGGDHRHLLLLRARPAAAGRDGRAVVPVAGADGAVRRVPARRADRPFDHDRAWRPASSACC